MKFILNTDEKKLINKNFNIGYLVKSNLNNLGIGKIVELYSSQASVEYFYSIAKQSRQMLPLTSLRTIKLRPQTRCYFRTNGSGQWQIGRTGSAKRTRDGLTYEVSLPSGSKLSLNETEIYVRCARPIFDPTEVLALRGHESAYFHARRSEFVRSLIGQRSAARGMTGLISSKIKLYYHQAEVVRRVLEDPIQRYLLADEVGLGKTIEAGAIIRQYLLDTSRGSVLILVPNLLLGQWRNELFEKFQIDEFPGRVRLLSVDDFRKIRLDDKYGLVVIDEAHHVAQMAFSPWPGERRQFEAFVSLAHRAERLLLMSATPVLNNEHSFLAMLYLLDPAIYKLSDIQKFKERVLKRQEIGRQLLSFKEGAKLFVIKKGLQNIKQMFSGDYILENLLRDLEEKLSGTDVSQDECDQVIRAIRIHITETYRLHRRMLRNRRENVEGDILIGQYRRGGHNNQLICQYDEDKRSEIIQDLLNEWREAAIRDILREYDPHDKKITARIKQMAKIFLILLECSGTWLGLFQNVITSRLKGRVMDELQEELGEEAYHLLRKVPLFEGERELLEMMLQAFRSPMPDGDRIKALEMLLEVNRNINLNLSGRLQKCVIFTSFTSTCRQIARRLITLFGERAVSKYYMDGSRAAIEMEVSRFRDDPECFLLVCDRSGEEGRNLQFADVLIHFDLPWSPNRIEQRIGRLDRIGREKALSSYVFVGPKCVNSLHEAWFKALDEGFGIFKNSIASLQFYVDDKMPELSQLVFLKGAGGIMGAIGPIQEEIKLEKVKIYEQYALDEIDALEKYETGYFDKLLNFDQNHAKIQRAVEPWLCDVLGFDREQDDFCSEVIRYRRGSQTLVPETVLSKLDPHLNKPGTYSRSVAVNISECNFYRVGNFFFNAIEKYTMWDDRGKTFIIWRHENEWEKAEWAGFRFDYIIEADIRAAKKILKSYYSCGLNLRALRNRAEAFFHPKYKTIYVDIEMNITEDPELLKILGRPFKAKLEGGSDYDLTNEQLHLLDEFIDPGCWPDLCLDARKAAESFLRDRSFVMACERAAKKAARELDARTGRLRMRKSRDTEIEQKIAGALVEGMRRPLIRLDSVGFIILSGRDPLSEWRRGRR